MQHRLRGLICSGRRQPRRSLELRDAVGDALPLGELRNADAAQVAEEAWSILAEQEQRAERVAIQRGLQVGKPIPREKRGEGLWVVQLVEARWHELLRIGHA